MPNNNTNSARAKTTTRILRKMAKNYCTHALPWPSHVRKFRWQDAKKSAESRIWGRGESKIFQKKNAKWFFSDNSDPE